MWLYRERKHICGRTAITESHKLTPLFLHTKDKSIAELQISGSLFGLLTDSYSEYQKAGHLYISDKDRQIDYS